MPSIERFSESRKSRGMFAFPHIITSEQHNDFMMATSDLLASSTPNQKGRDAFYERLQKGGEARRENSGTHRPLQQRRLLSSLRQLRQEVLSLSAPSEASCTKLLSLLFSPNTAECRHIRLTRTKRAEIRSVVLEKDLLVFLAE